MRASIHSAVSIIALIAASSGAWAQTSTTNSPPNPPTGKEAVTEPGLVGSGNQLEEVVVTAQKRSENIRDVPVSISVVGGGQAEQQHIVNYDDLTRAVPGISFSAGGATGSGVGAENIEIRGISSQVGSPTVGIYLDEVPVTLLNQSGTFQPKFFDMNRTEVLRGPQGTLFGASSEGGTVRFLTNQPDLDNYQVDVTGDVSGTINGDVNGDGRAVLNVPVIPGVLAFRFGGEYTDTSGWIDRYRYVPGEIQTPTTLRKTDVNAERDQVYKFVAKYQPEPDFSITPSIIYQREYQPDSPSFFINEGFYNQSKGTSEWAKDTDTVGSLTVTKGVGIGEVTSISSAFYREYNRSRDGTFYDPDVVVPYALNVDDLGDPNDAGGVNVGRTAPLAGTPATNRLATNPTESYDKDRSKVYTEELRIASPSKAESGLPLTYVAGFYFSNDTDDDNHYEPSPGWNSLFEKIYGFSPNDPTLSPIADPTDPHLWDNYFYKDISRRGVQQIAGFGQVDFDVLPWLHGGVGVRYQWSHLTYSRLGGGWWDLGTPANFGAETDDYALTPKFTARADISDDANIYVNIAKGYRDAGINNPVPEGLCGPYEKQIGITKSPESYGPDKLWNYEVGAKGLLMDRTLSVNVDAYYIQWTNVQQQILIPVCAFEFISNVGDADAYGGELEVEYKPPFLEGLALGFSGSIERTVVTSSSGNGAAQVGERLLYTPDFTADFNIGYTRPIADGFTGYVRLDYDYTGTSRGDFLQSATDFRNNSYGVLNGSVGVLTDEGLEVQLYAKNLANDRTIIKTPTIASITEGYTVQPLTIGLRAEYQFSVPAAESAPEIAAAMPTPAPAPAAPPPAPAPEAQRSFQVFFDFDKSTITAAASRVIAAAAEAIKAGNVVKITVTGHTDTVGSAGYNQALSERRAGAVKTGLVADGVSGGDIATVGLGKNGLLVPTADGVREPQNRRAEIVLAH